MSITFVQDIEGYLKEKYPLNKIQNTVNTATVLKQLFETDKKNTLGGLGNFIAVRVGLGGGVAFIAEGAQTAGGAPMSYIRLNIGGATINGSMEFTYQAEEYSTGDDAAFANVVDEQMQGLMENLALTFDRMYYTGGPTKGLTNTRDTSTATSGFFTTADATTCGFLAVDWNGEWDFLADYSLDVTDPATWCSVDCTRLDNQLPLSTKFAPGAPYGYWPTTDYSGNYVANGLIDLVASDGGTPTSGRLFIAAYNGSNVATSVNPGGGAITLPPKSVLIALGVLGGAGDGAGCTFTTEGVTGKEVLPGFMCAFRVDNNNYGNYTQPQTTVDGSLVNIASTYYSQPYGILHNLCDDTQFLSTGTRRSSSTQVQPDANATRFQSWAMSVATTGVQARTSLTREALTRGYDFTFSARGTQVDLLMTHGTQMSKYTSSLLTPTTSSSPVFLTNKPFEGMPDALAMKYKAKQTGESGFSFGNVNILVSQNCPWGLWFGISRSTWKVFTSKSGGQWLPNVNGGKIHALVGPAGRPRTAYQATWIDIYNCACIDCGSNTILGGMTI